MNSEGESGPRRRYRSALSLFRALTYVRRLSVTGAHMSSISNRKLAVASRSRVVVRDISRLQQTGSARRICFFTLLDQTPTWLKRARSFARTYLPTSKSSTKNSNRDHRAKATVDTVTQRDQEARAEAHTVDTVVTTRLPRPAAVPALRAPVGLAMLPALLTTPLNTPSIMDKIRTLLTAVTLRE